VEILCGVNCLVYSHLKNDRENYSFLMISILNKMALNLEKKKKEKQ